MKRRLHNAKDIIKGLARTITKVPIRKDGGDEEDEACFLKMENKELQVQLKEKERNCQQKEKEIHLLRNELKEINEQMKFLRDEVLELKRNSGKAASPKGSPVSRNGRRIDRTLRAMEKGEDTSVAEDSEAMEVELLPTYDWSTTEDSQVFKKPLPVRLGPNKATIPGPNGRSPHPGYLQQREDKLVQIALEESLKDIQDVRNKVKKYGTIAQETTGKVGESVGQDHMEQPKPQRPPRVIRLKSLQGLRTDIKVLENVQLVGPRLDKERMKRKEESATDQEWTVKKSRKEIRQEAKRKKEESLKQEQSNKSKTQQQQDRKQRIMRKPPRSAAVTIRIKEKDKDRITYADVLRKARENISLEEMGIERTCIRKTAGGNILIEIPGGNKSAEADKLAAELHKVLEKEVMVARPVIMGELRLFGLDDSISKEKIKEIIAAKGNCKITNVYTVDIRAMRNGLGMI